MRASNWRPAAIAIRRDSSEFDMKKTPLEARLSAYMDGETSREEKEELERLIASDAETRRLYEVLKRGSEVGRGAFDEVLREPVPLALVRAIKTAQPPKAREIPRFIPPSLKLAPTGRQALAASLILFFVGGGIGYFYGTSPTGQPPAQVAQAPAHGWTDDVAVSHRIYAHQPSHLAELPATQVAEIIQWLGGTVGVKFNVPDLSSVGLSFQGARLVVAQGKPTGELVYKNPDGEIIAIYFQKDGSNDESNDFNEVIKDDVGVVTWHRNDTAFAVVGPSADATLDDIAGRVSTTI
jgi:anti-sigma factor RsiW